MQVDCFISTESLQPLATDWQRLSAGQIFRGWIWQSTWQQQYCRAGQLRVLVVSDRDENPAAETPKVIAILPCYVQHSLTRGRVWRLCGDEQVCSDHLGLLVDPAHAESVATAVAKHLQDRDDWDLLELDYLDADDSASLALSDALQHADCQVTTCAGPQCWSIELPSTWEEYLATQSKSHRKQLRRLIRDEAAANNTTFHTVERPEQFNDAWEELIDLHQRRRQSLGEPGCFASPSWASFHREVAQRLLAAGQLQLSWVEIDGSPVAAEYHFANSTTTYAYQGGLDPDRLDDQPGRISLIHTLQRAIAAGQQRYDLLRGDEPYKPHWRATPTPTCRLIAVPSRATALWRHRAYRSLKQFKQLALSSASANS